MPARAEGDLFNLVTDDPDVVAAVKSLALEAVKQARDFLQPHTAPQLRMQFIRGVMPSLLASLKDRKPDDTDDDLRTELRNLFAEMRGETHAR